MLSRLAVLEGIRLVDQEQFPRAIHTWVASVRFSLGMSGRAAASSRCCQPK